MHRFGLQLRTKASPVSASAARSRTFAADAAPGSKFILVYYLVIDLTINRIFDILTEPCSRGISGALSPEVRYSRGDADPRVFSGGAAPGK